MYFVHNYNYVWCAGKCPLSPSPRDAHRTTSASQRAQHNCNGQQKKGGQRWIAPLVAYDTLRQIFPNISVPTKNGPTNVSHIVLCKVLSPSSPFMLVCWKMSLDLKLKGRTPHNEHKPTGTSQLQWSKENKLCTICFTPACQTSFFLLLLF